MRDPFTGLITAGNKLLLNLTVCACTFCPMGNMLRIVSESGRTWVLQWHQGPNRQPRCFQLNKVGIVKKNWEIAIMSEVKARSTE